MIHGIIYGMWSPQCGLDIPTCRFHGVDSTSHRTGHESCPEPRPRSSTLWSHSRRTCGASCVLALADFPGALFHVVAIDYFVGLTSCQWVICTLFLPVHFEASQCAYVVSYAAGTDVESSRWIITSDFLCACSVGLPLCVPLMNKVFELIFQLHLIQLIVIPSKGEGTVCLFISKPEGKVDTVHRVRLLFQLFQTATLFLNSPVPSE